MYGKKTEQNVPSECRIQHLLAAVPMNLSRDFAKQHDEALFGAVAATRELGNLTKRDRLLMQRKISNHGLGLRSMEKNLEFLFLAGFMRSITSNYVDQTHVS